MSTLAPGQRLGPYEILAPLGAGGMGEVYRARDTRLVRDVALKVLPAAVADNPDRRARFETEARAASALNHPGIVTVYDIGSDNGLLYLVAEFIDGATLRHQRPETLRRQLEIAAQVAEALAAAHAGGIIHRDLKPENIMLTARDERAKILDFGLARYNARGENEETLAVGPETQPGTIMGTVGYMSPEQARGRVADHRSDIFSLGAVMYELFGGGRAFEGETPADVFSAILKTTPAELGPSVPQGIRQVVERCLEKDASRRFQSAQDLAFALRALSGSSTAPDAASFSSQSASSPSLSAQRSWWPIVIGSLAALVLALAFWRLATEPLSPDISYYRFRPFASEEYQESEPVWSPDGKSIAYIARPGSETELRVKAIDGSAPAVLARAHGGIISVSWTPDGSRLFYIELDSSRSGPVLAVARAGGESVPATAGPAFAAAVSPDGNTLAALMGEGSAGNIQKALILFSPPGSAGKKVASFPGSFRPNRIVWSPDGGRILLSVAGQPSTIWSFEMRGGKISKIAEIPSFVMVSPAWLSDNRRMLVAWPTENNSRAELWVLDTETGRRRPALVDAEGLQFPAVSAGGTVAFTSGSTDSDLVELPLDGSAVRPLLATKQMESGVGWSPVSPDFAYVSQGSIHLRRRDGSSERTIVTGAHFPPGTRLLSPSFSPDGTRIAFSSASSESANRGWISPVGGGAPAPLGAFGSTFGLSWSPDGRWIAFNWAVNTTSRGMAKIRVGSSEQPQILMPNLCGFAPSWSPDGSRILCAVLGELAIVSAEGGQPELLGADYEIPALWSPDMRYIYAIRTMEGKRRLGRLDWKRKEFQPVVDIPMDWIFAESVLQNIRLSLSPDGKSLATTRLKQPGDIWLLEGFTPPPTLWQRLWRR